MTASAKVLARLAASHDRVRAELIEFASIASVSTDPAHAADVRAAQWVADELATAGPVSVRTMATAGNQCRPEPSGLAGAPGRCYPGLCPRKN